MSAACAAHVNVTERLRPLPVLRRNLHDDVVLVELRVGDRHLALAEGVVEDIVDHLGGNAETGGRIPVDHQGGLQPLVLLVAAHVDKVGQRPEALQHAGRPRHEFGQVVSRERVLVHGIGSSFPRRAGPVRAGGRWAPPVYSASFRRSLAITWPSGVFRSSNGFREMNSWPMFAGVPPPAAAAGEAADVLDVGVALDDVEDLGELRPHGLEGDVLIRLDGPADPPRVLLGEEALRDDHEEIDVRRHRDDDRRGASARSGAAPIGA